MLFMHIDLTVLFHGISNPRRECLTIKTTITQQYYFIDVFKEQQRGSWYRGNVNYETFLYTIHNSTRHACLLSAMQQNGLNA